MASGIAAFESVRISICVCTRMLVERAPEGQIEE